MCRCFYRTLASDGEVSLRVCEGLGRIGFAYLFGAINLFVYICVVVGERFTFCFYTKVFN